jgi:hypothetical protein
MPPHAAEAKLAPTSTEVDVLAALTAMQAEIEHLLATVERHERALATTGRLPRRRDRHA